MKWLTAQHLESWADRVDARVRLSEIVAQLVRASADESTTFDFPTGDSAQRPGYDGRLVAIPAQSYREFLPEGNSVWEFGADKDYYRKVNEDYAKRSESPGEAVDPSQTVFILVTPRIWVRSKPTLAEWIAQRKEEARWKDVKAFDAVTLEAWLEMCPAVAGSVARDVVGTLPVTGALSASEYWQEYCARFEPRLREEVVTAGRQKEVRMMLEALGGRAQINRWQGDSLDEVLAFMVACIRTSEENVRKFLESRVLLLESKDASRRLADSPNLIFSVNGEATELAGRLASSHPVILPLGRDSLTEGSTTRLSRPSTSEVSEALKLMGLDEERSHRLARESDRSVTILARRIPSATAKRPSWHNDAILLPAFLAGAWDVALQGDRTVLARLAGEGDYSNYEAKIRRYRQLEDAPLESADTVWAVRAPVDVFVNLATLFGAEHFAILREVSQEVFGQIDPALDLGAEDRPFARLRGATLPHSTWLREGLTNTLLTIAALGEKSGLAVAGTTPQLFVNEVVAGIPGLRDDHRVLSSLSHQLPLLMEAAPDPLLLALEQLLKGDGKKLVPIFQDAEGRSLLFTQSPHTGFLWALEMIAWDPAHIARAASILLKLAQIDPGGTLNNRPLGSLRDIFLAWRPGTNASLRERMSVMDRLLEQDDSVGWNLLVELLPKGPDFADAGVKPTFREAGASEREVLTHGLVFRSYHEVIHRAIARSGVSADRWRVILDRLHSFPEPERKSVIDELEGRLEHFTSTEKLALWDELAGLVRRHKVYSDAVWSLKKDVVDRLQKIEERLRPDDPIREVLWLFEDSPAISYANASDFLQTVEDLRKDAVATVLNQRGIGGVLDLALQAKGARYVGFAAGCVLQDPTDVRDLSIAAFDRGSKLDSFISLLSAAALDRLGKAWLSGIRAWQKSGGLTSGQAFILTVAWPHKRSTWEYIKELGDDVYTAYWQGRQAWGVQGDSADLVYAVEQYLAAERAELIVLGLSHKAKDIPGPLLLQTLDQFDRRIGMLPSMLKAQNLAFDLEQFFAALQNREDVSLMEIAVREYRYLPLLRETRVFSRGSHSLALDKFMAESPEFFVKIICDVFLPASKRGSKSAEVSDGVRARAHTGWTLLEGFTTIPGLSTEHDDIQVLQNWVSEVRRLAASEDRLVIAEQKIGSLLAHAPEDPEDHLWPHRIIRQCLEDWQLDEIERGIGIERFNMRGVVWRNPREGGTQERDLAGDLRDAAKRMNSWQRTQKFLLGLADAWDESAKREDLRARQDEMRE
jgi:hypothetical protein